MTDHWYEVRWSCRTCGRFLPESAIRSWDVLDNGEYYGVRSVTVADCPRCGETPDPALVPTKAHEFTEDDCPGPIPEHGCRFCRSDAELYPERYLL